MRKTGELGRKILEYAVLAGATYISLSNPKSVKYLGRDLVKKIRKYNLGILTSISNQDILEKYFNLL